MDKDKKELMSKRAEEMRLREAMYNYKGEIND